MSTPEISHRIEHRGDAFIVTEKFGDKETVWQEQSIASAEETIAIRRAILRDLAPK